MKLNLKGKFMTKDAALKRHADKLSGIATQLMSLMKDFNREFKAFCKDAETKWQDKKSQMDYVVQELLTPVDDLIQANGENVYDYLNDAQEILRIESGYQSAGNPVEDLFEEREKARDRTAQKQAELDQRREWGLKFAASKPRIVPSLWD